MIQLANTGDKASRVPPFIGPIQIELAIIGIAPEIDHVRVAIHDKQLCTRYRHKHHRPLNALRIESYSGSKIH